MSEVRLEDRDEFFFNFVFEFDRDEFRELPLALLTRDFRLDFFPFNSVADAAISEFQLFELKIIC